MTPLAPIVKAKFPNLVLETIDQQTDEVVVIKKEGLIDICKALKNDVQFQFNFLMDLTAVDYLHWEEKEFRFELIYNLFSFPANRRLFIKARVADADAAIDSVTALWPSADWHEREVWDMFGIRFNGHPNLKRILMYEGFEGHPLRKDYPYNKRQPLVGPMN